MYLDSRAGINSMDDNIQFMHGINDFLKEVQTTKNADQQSYRSARQINTNNKKQERSRTLTNPGTLNIEGNKHKIT